MRTCFGRSPRAGAVVLALVISACSDDDDSQPRISDPLVDDLDATLRQTRADLGVRGVIAGIWAPGLVSWVGTDGVADESTGERITTSHHVRIGSVTKTFTVTILLRLVDAGVVGLDDPVGKWVPETPNGEAITLRELGNMTAGLGSYTFVESFQNTLFSDPYRAWTSSEILDVGFAETRGGCKSAPDACFAAGQGWFYSNTNTVLLAVALERATGTPYAALLQQYVLDPLDLHQTSQATTGTLTPPYVRGYSIQGTPPGAPPQETTNWNPSWGYAVGDIVSTISDLRVYAKALGTGAGLSPAMREARFTTVTIPPNTPARAYALGIGYENGWWGHTGELPGYSAAVYYRPDIDAVLVVSASADVLRVNGEEVAPMPVLVDKLRQTVDRAFPPNNVPLTSIASAQP